MNVYSRPVINFEIEYYTVMYEISAVQLFGILQQGQTGFYKSPTGPRRIR